MNFPDRAGVLSPADRPLRLVRSVAAALACVLTAALGHYGAGGQLSAPAVLAVFVGGTAITWLLSSRRVALGQIIGLLVLCQVSVHWAGSEMTMDAQMMLGHIAATAVSALALSRGERFIWRLAERLGLRAMPILQTANVVPSLRPLVPVMAPRSRHDVLLAHSRSLRGPPIGS